MEDYNECMKTLEDDIADIKAEMVVVKQNFTRVDKDLETIELQGISNFMSIGKLDTVVVLFDLITMYKQYVLHIELVKATIIFSSVGC